MSDLPRLEAGMKVIVVSDYGTKHRVMTIDRVTPKRAYIHSVEIDRDTWNVRGGHGYDTPMIFPITPERLEKAEKQRLTKAVRAFPLDGMSVDQLRRIHQIMEEGK